MSEKKVLKYKMVKEVGVVEFQRAISMRLEQGYRLHGNFQVHVAGPDVWFFQAMVQEEKGDDVDPL